MDFINSFNQQGPLDPYSFNYRQQMLELQRQNELAQNFSNVKATPGAGKFAGLAAVLAQGLGGYMQGKNSAAAGQSEQSAKDQAEYFSKLLRNQQSPDELDQAARTFYPDQAAGYTYKNPAEVGPAFEAPTEYRPAANSQAAYAAMPNGGLPNPATRVGTEVGRATNISGGGGQFRGAGATGSWADPVGPAAALADVRANEAARAQRLGVAATQPRPVATPAAPTAPQAPQAPQQPSIPSASSVYGVQAQPQPAAPPTLADTFNVDNSGQQEALRGRSAFIRDALRRQSMNQAEAEQTLEQSQNPYALPFLKRAAAQRQSEADMQKFMMQERIKSTMKREEASGKPVGGVQFDENGNGYIVRGDGTRVAVDARDPKIVAEIKARDTARGSADITLKRITSDIDTVLGGNDPEKASGMWAKISNGWTNFSGQVTDASQARARMDGLASQAIQTMINSMQQSGVSPTQLANTEVEAKRLAGSIANIDYSRMSSQEIRRQLDIFRNQLTDLARNSLASNAGPAPSSAGTMVSPTGRKWVP